MSEKQNESKSKIEDLPEKEELSAEELETAAGGLLRSPAAGLGSTSLKYATTQETLDTNGMPDTTSASSDT